MRIDRFAVRGFRKLAGGAAVEGLEPGITVIAGDNEEGKSTLLKALQSAFFDRHNLTGKSVEDMMPFGTKGLRPRVEVGFELAGTGYRLEKTFGRHPSALLEGGSKRWEGLAAEDRLRDLLGFSRPGRGAAGEEHRGLAGLLWVEQGRAFQPLGMSRDSQAVLREAIESEVGQVLGGERGRRLLDRVAKRTGEYFTGTGRERAALTGPREHAAALAEEYGALESELRAYEDRVERLGKLQETLARYRRDGSLARAKREAEEAGIALRRLAEVEGRLETATARMEQSKSAGEVAEAARKGAREPGSRGRSSRPAGRPGRGGVEGAGARLSRYRPEACGSGEAACLLQQPAGRGECGSGGGAPGSRTGGTRGRIADAR